MKRLASNLTLCLVLFAGSSVSVSVSQKPLIVMTCKNISMNTLLCENNDLTLNSTINETLRVSSVEGDYNKLTSGLAMKILIVDSKVKFLPNGLGDFFPNLVHVNVIKSELEIIKRQNFIGMNATRYLHLQHNKIKTITDDTFRELMNLRKINLSGNEIQFLPTEAFNHMSHLIRFICNDNAIELFDSDIFQYNTKLIELHLWGNNIKAIRFAAKKHLRLSTFDLRKNRCIDILFYLLSAAETLEAQREIITKCSFYVKKEGQLFYRNSRVRSSLNNTISSSED